MYQFLLTKFKKWTLTKWTAQNEMLNYKKRDGVSNYLPASSPLIRYTGGISMQSLLNVRHIVILLCIVLRARIITRKHPTTSYQSVLEPHWPQRISIIRNVGQACGGVNAVGINVAKLIVGCVVNDVVALLRVIDQFEVAVFEDWFVGGVRDYGVRPPERHRSYVVVVVVCHCIPHLYTHMVQKNPLGLINHVLRY